MNPRHRQILGGLLECPTAPFAESAVIRYVQRWAADWPLDVAQDQAGNLLLNYRHRNRGRDARATPHWIFAAHMDHPGFVATGRRGRELRAEFRGGVDLKYFAKARVRFFLDSNPGMATEQRRGHGTQCGTVLAARKSKQSPFIQCRIRLDGPQRGQACPLYPAVAAGAVGMWNFPGVRFSGQRISSRCCDDVIGCAAVLCAMEEIIASSAPAHVTALLTRAEEAGFIGALSASVHESLPKDGLIVAIEASKAHASARLGEGVIVRVGDRARTFDPSLTAHVAAIAQKLAARDKAFRFSRQLMSGGTCESTAYAMFGYRATGLCLALGNYHNQGQADKVAPEQIDARDFDCLVKLLAALPADDSSPEKTDQALMDRLQGLIKERQRYL